MLTADLLEPVSKSEACIVEKTHLKCWKGHRYLTRCTDTIAFMSFFFFFLNQTLISAPHRPLVLSALLPVAQGKPPRPTLLCGFCIEDSGGRCLCMCIPSNCVDISATCRELQYPWGEKMLDGLYRVTCWSPNHSCMRWPRCSRTRRTQKP